MKYKTKTQQIRDQICFDIIAGKLNDGDMLYDKRYFTAMFKVSPKYVDDAITNLINQGLLEQREDKYYVSADDDKKSALRNEFLNESINNFIHDIDELGISLEEAIEMLRLRGLANG